MAVIFLPKGKGGGVFSLLFLIVFLAILAFITPQIISLTGLTNFNQIPFATFIVYSSIFIFVGMILFFLLMYILSSLTKR